MSKYEDGKALGEHILDLAAKATEYLPDDAELLFVSTQSVWRCEDGRVEVITAESDIAEVDEHLDL
jgi:hypothetical protein